MCFLQNIHYMEKKFYTDLFLLKKFFLPKMKTIYIEIFFYPENTLLKLRGELNNLVLKVSEGANMWYSLS